jgi:hypothetical protein
MNQAPQQRRRNTLPHGPHHIIQLLIGQSSKRYAAIKEMIKNQTDGFFDLQRETQQLAQFIVQEDGSIDVRIHRLAAWLQANLAMAEINRQDLERHCQLELMLQGELNRWLRGQRPTQFQGPPLPPEMNQPIVPGYQPPAPQLPPAGGTQDGAQPQGQQAPQGYFRQGPNGLEPIFGGGQGQPQPQVNAPTMFPTPQYPMQPPPYTYPQAPQMQPQPSPPPALQGGQQMFGPYPPPPQQGYGQPQYAPQGYPPPGYGYQPPPQPMPNNQFPVMQQSQQDPSAPPTLAPIVQAMPQQVHPQFASPDAARQAVLPDAPPPPAVPTSVVHFPMPNAPQAGQPNGAPPAQPQK